MSHDLERVDSTGPVVPVVEFMDPRPDPVTGEAVLSSWWLLPEPRWPERKILAEVVPHSEGRVVLTVGIASAQAL